MPYRKRKRTRSETRNSANERQCKRRRCRRVIIEDDYHSSSSMSSSTDLARLLEEADDFLESDSPTYFEDVIHEDQNENQLEDQNKLENQLEDQNENQLELKLDAGAESMLKSIAEKLMQGIIEEAVPQEIREIEKETTEMEKAIMGIAHAKPLKWRVLKSDAITLKSKRAILPMIDAMLEIEQGSETYGKYKQYVKCINKIPFGKYIEQTINAESTPLEVATATNGFHATINKCLYGQYTAKNKLTQIIHNGFTNPSATPQVIGLQGPPGVGKTTLIKYGLAVAQKRPFFMYPLGGAKEGGYLEGFNMAFVGATNGWISNSLMIGGSMNPVFFFDELDKVSETKEGREIIGVLMRLIDPVQNTTFCDRFLPNVELDMSKAIFIFSYNNRKKVDPILMDRITEISMGGYTVSDKKVICRDYIIKEMAAKVGMEYEDVIFTDEIIQFIISRYTAKEKGVRSLQKAIKQIFMKLNILRFKDINPQVMGTSYIPDLKFPLTLTSTIVQILLHDTAKLNYNPHTAMMYL